MGTDVANRNRVETENLIGFFTNLLPLRSRIAPELKFTDLLAQVRETTRGANASDLPLKNWSRNCGRNVIWANPLVQVLLVMNQPPLKIDYRTWRCRVSSYRWRAAF